MVPAGIRSVYIDGAAQDRDVRVGRCDAGPGIVRVADPHFHKVSLADEDGARRVRKLLGVLDGRGFDDGDES